MRRIVLGFALTLMASASSAQVTQTGSVFSNGGWAPPQPTTQFVQSCNGGAGGIVGQNSCAQPISGSISASFSQFAPISPSVTLTATSTSSNALLTASGTTLSIYNGGTTTAYGALGASNAVTASATSPIVIPAGTTVGVGLGSNTYLAVYAASGSDTIIATSGAGGVGGYGGGGSGGGGAVTAVSGAYAAGSIVDIGTGASPSANTLNYRLAAELAQLQTGVNALQGGAANSLSNPFYVSPATGSLQAVQGSQSNAAGGTTGSANLGVMAYNYTWNGTSWAQWNGSVGLNAGTNAIGSITNTGFNALQGGTANSPTNLFYGASYLSPTTTNPTSTLTLPSTTTAYASGQLVASSATAGSVVVPSFAIAASAGGAAISRLRLSTNDTTSTAWGGVGLQVDLWLAVPTFTNGDRGTFLPATGTASHLGAFTCTMSAEYGDGAYCEMSPSVGSFALPKIASGTAIYWTLQTTSASGVTGASKAFVVTAELLN